MARCDGRAIPVVMEICDNDEPDPDDGQPRQGDARRRGLFNTAEGGLCCTIKANYWKMNHTNFAARHKFKATAVIEIYDER